MLGFRFSFEAYGKTYKRRQLSALWKLQRFYWILMDMCLPKFNIYQRTAAPNCFKSYINSRCPEFFQKKVVSDVWPEIHLVWRNIVSTGQSVCLKKNIFRPENKCWQSLRALTWLEKLIICQQISNELYNDVLCYG